MNNECIQNCLRLREKYFCRSIDVTKCLMKLKKICQKMLADIRTKNMLMGVFGAFITAFGIYNVHDVADITEGGVLGLNLLLDHWLGISPAYTNAILTLICFVIGWKALGRTFVIYSIAFSGAFSLSYRVLERFTPQLMPWLAERPWLAAFIGCLFVGVGVGWCVRAGGAMSGDDALAMAFRHFFGVKLSTVYFISDISVLLLSLTYIPASEILWSLLTVVLSGQIIEIVTNIGIKRKDKTDEKKTELGSRKTAE